MRAVVKTSELYEAMVKAGRVCKNLIMKNLKEAKVVCKKDGGITVYSTDLEKIICTTVKAEVDEDFTVILPIPATVKFLSKKSGKTTIETETSRSNSCKIEQEGIGEIYFNELTFLDSFPKVDLTIPTDGYSELDTKWLYRMFKTIIPACGLEDRPVLSGVLVKDGAMASADGFRLVVIKNNNCNYGLGDKEAIIPSRTLVELPFIFKEEKISVGFDLPNHVCFKAGNTYVLSQLVQGTFPRYEQLVPQTMEYKITFSAPLMVERLKLVDKLIMDGAGIIRMLNTKDKKGNGVCVLSGGEVGYAGFEMELPANVEVEGKIALHDEYLIHALNPFSVCLMSYNSPSQPAVFTGDIEGLTIVVMPMFVQW